jgi:predicted nuclease of predicted toxin-antitoxin system
MRILVDENIPLQTVEILIGLKHDVHDIRGTSAEGMTDDGLWALAQSEKCLLLTTDKGFARRRHERHYGILVVLLRQPNSRKIHERVLMALRDFSEGEWPGLLVIMRDTVRSAFRCEEE